MTVNLAPQWPLFYTIMTVILYKMNLIFRFLNNGIFRPIKMTVNLKKIITKLTVKQPKWPLSPKMTVIDAQNSRCGLPKWPLFKPKWPLYTEQKLTVILVEKVVQYHRYIYKRNSRSFWGNSDVGVIVMLVTKQGC